MDCIVTKEYSESNERRYANFLSLLFELREHVLFKCSAVPGDNCHVAHCQQMACNKKKNVRETFPLRVLYHREILIGRRRLQIFIVE